MQREAAIVGIGRTAFSKESGRTTLAMAAEATRSALADAGLTGGEVDGVVDFQLNDSAAASEVGGAIGARDLSLALDIFGGGNVACLAMAEGIRAVRSGQCDVVVVFRSLNGRSATRFGRGEDSPNLAGEFQYGAANGYIIPPMWIGMWAQRHKHVYGTTAADFGHIAITQRRHASANPHASQRKIITMDDYLASRWIVEPFRLFDCCLETDGAVAIVLTALDRARHLRHKPIIPLAEAEAHTHGNSWSQFPDLTSMYSRYAARRLWDKTDLKPADVDVACMYDCFTYTVLATFEDFGLTAREFWRAAGRGILELSRCTACGRWEHPPRENCAECGAAMHLEPSSGIGVVHSYIVLHHNTILGFAGVLPFAIALVEFEGGCRLPARVVGEYDRETLIGSTVQAEFERLAPDLAPALLVRVVDA